MKIRNGYVSNSSSSSFLVIYKQESDFDKFKEFDGYQDFMDDLYGEDSSGFDFIVSVIDDYLYTMKSNFVNLITQQKNPNYFEDIYARNIWIDLPYDFKYEDKSIMRKVEKLRKSSQISVEELEKCYRGFNVEKDAKKFVDFLKEKGYKIKAMDYGDDTERGAFMEHRFMPFLAKSPEGNFEIYIINNH